MMAHDEDLLACDLAETYHIYDMFQFPVRTVARLAYGLRYDSRIRTSMSGHDYRLSDLLLAAIVDRLTGAHDGPGVLQILLGQAKTDNRPVGFASGQDFESARMELLRRINDGH